MSWSKSLYVANQAESLLSSLFKILFKGTGSFSEINKLASSANKIHSRREASPRSLTYMMKNIGGQELNLVGHHNELSQRAIYGRYILQTEISDKSSF